MQVVNTPRDYVRALTCGLPKRLRERTMLCMMQAFADESDKGSMVDGVLTISGYVGFCSKWETFTDEWMTVIDNDPVFRSVGF